MALGLCARCNRRGGCRYRQPGTWVVECGRFDQSLQPARPDAPSGGITRRQPASRITSVREPTQSQSV